MAKSMPDVTFQKFLTPHREGKTGRSSPKSLVRPATGQCSSLSQISWDSAKQCTRKVLQFFYPLVNSGALGDQLGQSSPILELIYKTCNNCLPIAHRNEVCRMAHDMCHQVRKKFILLTCLTKELTYRSVDTLIDWFMRLMPRVQFIFQKTFAL